MPPALPAATPPLQPTYESAVDALVATGFKATGEQLAQLARDVKERIGEATEPAAKKPRGLQKELSGLGGALDAPLELRGDAAAREHERGRGRARR